MTLNQMTDLRARLMHQDHTPVLWNPPGYSQVSVPVKVLDIRKVFNRIDVCIHVLGRPEREQVWVSLETISGVLFD